MCGNTTLPILRRHRSERTQALRARILTSWPYSTEQRQRNFSVSAFQNCASLYHATQHLQLIFPIVRNDLTLLFAAQLAPTYTSHLLPNPPSIAFYPRPFETRGNPAEAAMWKKKRNAVYLGELLAG